MNNPEKEPVENFAPENNPQKILQPEDLGYKKFNEKQQKEALLKAKTLQDKDGDKELRSIEAELAAAGHEDKKLMRPEDVTTLDGSLKLNEKDQKNPQEALKAKEKQSFVMLFQKLQEKNKIPVETTEGTHVLEFKGLQKEGADMKPQEVQKMLEKMDKGGEMPPNVEFNFHTVLLKNREGTAAPGIDYRLNIRQVMEQGLTATLTSLLSLSYSAASNYEAGKNGVKSGKEQIEAPKPAAEKNTENTLGNLKKQIVAQGFQTGEVNAGQWQALEVSIPAKQKQLMIVCDGEIFRVNEKKEDKNMETPLKSPQEVLQYIEKESK